MDKLFLALSLALGEACILWAPGLGSLWPAFSVAALIVFLLGFGFAHRLWPFVAIFLLGAALYGHATTESARQLRDSPWLRQRTHASEPRAIPTLKQELIRRTGIGLRHDPETASLNAAMLLGVRDRVPRRLTRVFQNAGTIHVFAISGLHVMVIANVLFVLLALLFVPLRVRALLSIPLLWAYVLLTGAAPSAIRAATMAGLYLLAIALRRRPDALVAWSLAFIAQHTLAPRLITDVGAQLSFAVMLVLIGAARASRHWRSLFAQSAFITTMAWAGGLPIAAHAFGRVTPGGLLANMILLGTASHSVALGAVGVLVSFVSPSLAAYLNNLSAIATRTLVGVSCVVARLPGATFTVDAWPLGRCVLWYLALAALILYLLHRARDRRIV